MNCIYFSLNLKCYKYKLCFVLCFVALNRNIWVTSNILHKREINSSFEHLCIPVDASAFYLLIQRKGLNYGLGFVFYLQICQKCHIFGQTNTRLELQKEQICMRARIARGRVIMFIMLFMSLMFINFITSIMLLIIISYILFILVHIFHNCHNFHNLQIVSNFL